MATEPVELPDITSLILTIRAQRVLLAADLARLYGLPTKALNQAVKRHPQRFPPDFAFRLTADEREQLRRLRSQFVTLKRGQHSKYPELVFTERRGASHDPLNLRCAPTASIGGRPAFSRSLP